MKWECPKCKKVYEYDEKEVTMKDLQGNLPTYCSECAPEPPTFGKCETKGRCLKCENVTRD